MNYKKIKIEDNVTIALGVDCLCIQGPLGRVSLAHDSLLCYNTDNIYIYVTYKSIHFKNFNKFQTRIKSFMKGVLVGFYSILEIKGIGYRFTVKNDALFLKVGYNHDIEYIIPSQVSIKQISSTKLFIQSINYELLKQVTSKIRKYKVPDVYKGKGILYENEIIKLKEIRK